MKGKVKEKVEMLKRKCKERSGKVKEELSGKGKQKAGKEKYWGKWKEEVKQ